MKKLFNKKTIIAYIVILCLAFIAGSVSTGLAVSYSEKYNAAYNEAENKLLSDNSLNELENSLLNVIVKGITEQAGISTEKNLSLSAEVKAYKQLKSTLFTVAIVLYVLSLLSVAGIITCVQYEKYLKSEKYKAKLKRMKKYGNSYNTGM